MVAQVAQTLITGLAVGARQRLVVTPEEPAETVETARRRQLQGPR